MDITAIRIIVVDDHALIREGLKKLITEQWDMEVVAECSSGSELMDTITEVKCDVIILDINLPGKTGIDILYDLKARVPKVQTLVLSMYPEERFAVRALKEGASGYLTKGCAPEELTSAIRRVAKGGRYISESLADRLVLEMQHGNAGNPHELLSNREFQVLMMIGAGKSTKEITDALSVSQSTVNTYRMRILQKVNLKTTRDLIRYVVQMNLVD